MARIPNLAELAAALHTAATSGDEAGFLSLLAANMAPEVPAAPEPTVNLHDLVRRYPEPPKPEFFFGDLDKPPSVRSWLFEIKQYLRLWTSMTEEEKINFSVTLLRSHALNWWQQMQSMAVQGTIQEICTFSQFEEAITAQFGGFETAERARDILADLRQVSSVENYVRRFREALLLLGNDYLDSDMRHRFILGLKPGIQRQVRIEAPPTLDKAMLLAERIGRVRLGGLDLAEHSVAFGDPSIPRQAFHAGPSQSAAAPMEIDAIRTSGRRKLTDRERTWLEQNDGCFYCRQPNAGHTARNCPEKRQ